ncbi:hypothetical protein EYV94_20040 [Puteibacter caeruleilacunae]|nr:hypothetical protein EYV94_20040 [Puteibacter caeruleilacunae]
MVMTMLLRRKRWCWFAMVWCLIGFRASGLTVFHEAGVGFVDNQNHKEGVCNGVDNIPQNSMNVSSADDLSVLSRAEISITGFYTPPQDQTICSGSSAILEITSNEKAIDLKSNQYISISNNSDINTTVHNERTIALWFKVDNSSSRQVLYEEGGGVNGISMYIENNEVYVNIWEDRTTFGGSAIKKTIQSDKWYHLAFVYDGNVTISSGMNNFKGYLNGVEFGGVYDSRGENGLKGHSGDINIGRSGGSLIYAGDSSDNNSNYFSGQIDEFKLWNKALSQIEIENEMDNVMTSVSDPKMVIYYSFNNDSEAAIGNVEGDASHDGIVHNGGNLVSETPFVPTIRWHDDNSFLTSRSVSPAITTTYDYTLTLHDNDTQGSVTVTVSEIVLSGDVTDETRPVARDGAIDLTVSGGTLPYTFLWSTTDGAGLSSGDEDQNGLGNGQYEVLVTDANNCTASHVYTIAAGANRDTDGDGITDDVDEDDDNDGITDCEENGLDVMVVGDLFIESGDASAINDSEIRLTPDNFNQAGTAMYIHRLDLRDNFIFNFEANLGSRTSDGADGMALIFHNDPRGTAAIGADGEGMGAHGIANGIVLELDTWYNSHRGDIPSDHGCIWKSSDMSIISSPISLGELEDGDWHDVQVIWNASTSTILYTVDRVLAGQHTGDIINDYFGGAHAIYFGLTAATGASRNDQRVRFADFCDLPSFVDTDNDGTPNSEDLDSDGDGCFDVIEAGFTDPNNDGELGDVPLTVDANGLVTGAGGYTTPADTDGNGTQDYVEVGPPIVFTQHPSDVTLCEGNSISFTVAADRGDKYQWQVDTGSGWENISEVGDDVYSNQTTTTLEVSEVAGLNGNKYRCMVSRNDCYEESSNEATLTVNKKVRTLAIQRL